MKQRYFNINDWNLKSPLYRFNEDTGNFYFFDAEDFIWILWGHYPETEIFPNKYEITKKEASLLKNKIKHNALAEKLSK